jgi:amino acid transporter
LHICTVINFKQFKKMEKKYFKYINTLFVVIPMTLIMAFVGLMRNYGFGEDWFWKFLKAWSVMLPVAYLAAFIIIPNARKLSEKITA